MGDVCRLTGRPDFLYVADAKFCTCDAMDYVDRRRRRFVTVLPRAQLGAHAATILRRFDVERYLQVRVEVEQAHRYRQE